MEVGDFVRGERKRQGLTQQQLATKSGVGLNFVYQLEKNKPSVQLDSLNQVLRALGYCVSVQRDFRPWDASEANGLANPNRRPTISGRTPEMNEF